MVFLAATSPDGDLAGPAGFVGNIWPLSLILVENAFRARRSVERAGLVGATAAEGAGVVLSHGDGSWDNLDQGEEIVCRVPSHPPEGAERTSDGHRLDRTGLKNKKLPPVVEKECPLWVYWALCQGWLLDVVCLDDHRVALLPDVGDIPGRRVSVWDAS